MLMKKIGIIICERYQSCGGGKCFRALRERVGTRLGVGWDETYWTNYPGAENVYTQPYHHWPNFEFMLPFLKSTGKK
jgi:hypothetical protein